MQCPVCQKNKLKSTIHKGKTRVVFNKSLENEKPESETLTPSYYDDKGNYYQRDMNTYVTKYSCSRGHKWDLYKREGKEWVVVEDKED